MQAWEWRGEVLRLLDQRRLPHEQVWLECRDTAGVAEAIEMMAVRGAPLIGVAAAFGAVFATREAMATADPDQGLRSGLSLLRAARPTAVNLMHAVDGMAQHLQSRAPSAWPAAALEWAQGLAAREQANNTVMAEYGAALVSGEAVRVLTHCNTGSLATPGVGTALGVVRAVHAEGRLAQVYADETRPWLQGARLTAFELQQDGLPVTLICEGMVASLMAAGRVDWVIVGADRITARGDVANKIGTLMLAVLARHYGVRFMVVAPTSTFDLALEQGREIPIEERDPDELRRLQGVAVAPADVPAWNPAFDVTPAELIDCIITERGVVAPVCAAAVRSVVGSG